MRTYGIDQRVGPDHIFGNLIDAYTAFQNRAKAPSA